MKIGGRAAPPAARLWELLVDQVAALDGADQVWLVRAFQDRSPWDELPPSVRHALGRVWDSLP